VAIQFLRNAYRGTGPYAREKPRTNLRLIANIQDPSYVLVAAKAATGITDLSQMRHHPRGAIPHEVTWHGRREKKGNVK